MSPVVQVFVGQRVGHTYCAKGSITEQIVTGKERFCVLSSKGRGVVPT